MLEYERQEAGYVYWVLLLLLQMKMQMLLLMLLLFVLGRRYLGSLPIVHTNHFDLGSLPIVHTITLRLRCDLPRHVKGTAYVLGLDKDGRGTLPTNSDRKSWVFSQFPSCFSHWSMCRWLDASNMHYQVLVCAHQVMHIFFC